MVTFKQYTFTNVTANHTITAEFEEDEPSPTPTPPTSNIRLFIKQNGVWVPLFT